VLRHDFTRGITLVREPGVETGRVRLPRRCSISAAASSHRCPFPPPAVSPSWTD